MKKIIIILVLTICITLTGGCSNKTDEQDPLLGLCNEIDTTINDYRSQKIDKTEFIDTIRSFKEECNGNEYLCTSITSFDMVEDTYSDEILDAYITNLEVGCQKIKDQSEEE